jgi:phosphate starvation-inducible PhoH-like protein
VVIYRALAVVSASAILAASESARAPFCAVLCFQELLNISYSQEAPPGGDEPVKRSVSFEDPELLRQLSGPHSAVLRELSLHSGAQVKLRGNDVHFVGKAQDVDVAVRFVRDATRLLEEGHEIHVADVSHSVRGLRQDPSRSLVDYLDQAILITPRRRPIAPKTAAQRQYVAAIRKHTLTFGIGPAGTGKTYLAMAMAASALLQRKVKRIILTRPAVEAGERLGFLPGDLAEKVNPYLRPLYDALNDMIDYEKLSQLRSENQIEVAPLAFMRGRTLTDAFIVLDEAQNATVDQMKMFLTRLGYGSTAVVTGDVTQTDLPRGTRSGLSQARQILGQVEGISFCEFTDVDVVRHPLVQKIVLAYEKYDEQQLVDREQLRGSLSDSKPSHASRERVPNQVNSEGAHSEEGGDSPDAIPPQG